MWSAVHTPMCVDWHTVTLCWHPALPITKDCTLELSQRKPCPHPSCLCQSVLSQPQEKVLRQWTDIFLKWLTGPSNWVLSRLYIKSLLPFKKMHKTPAWSWKKDRFLIVTKAESSLNWEDDILAGDMPGLVSAPLEEHRVWGLAVSAGVAS